MHLHMHLRHSIRTFDPAPAFWPFSFERLNGILGAYKTNRKNIEMQVMRKTLLDLGMDDTVQPLNGNGIFGPVFETIRGENEFWVGEVPLYSMLIDH